MKNIKYLSALLLGVTMFLSCSESFLNVTPEGALTEDVYFSNESSLNNALNAVYSTINWRFFRLGQMYFSTHEICSDDFIPGLNADFIPLQNFTYLEDNYMIQRYWEQYYGYLNRCNQTLALASKFTTNANVKQIEAQAKFFRAYYHFDLMNVFGQTVLRDHVPSAAEYNIPKSSEAQIRSSVISDLMFAINNLPTRSEWGTANNGRVSKGTAQGLLAKVYLYNQQYDSAYKYSDAVVKSQQFDLFNSYRDLYAKGNTYSVENMMPGHFTYQNIAGRLRNPLVEWQGVPTTTNKLGSANLLPSADIVGSYEVGDPRKTASIFTIGETIDGVDAADLVWRPGFQYANKKVIWPKSTWDNSDFFTQALNLTFMRYAEILLMRAESANELGNSAVALADIEYVRNRARGGNNSVLPKIVETDKAKLRELIWKERRVELAFEGQRWLDLVRYEKVVPGYMTAIMQKLGRTNFNYAKHHRFPLPLTYVTSSQGVLTQSAAWGGQDVK